MHCLLAFYFFLFKHFFLSSIIGMKLLNNIVIIDRNMYIHDSRAYKKINPSGLFLNIYPDIHQNTVINSPAYLLVSIGGWRCSEMFTYWWLVWNLPNAKEMKVNPEGICDVSYGDVALMRISFTITD